MNVVTEINQILRTCYEHSSRWEWIKDVYILLICILNGKHVIKVKNVN